MVTDKNEFAANKELQVDDIMKFLTSEPNAVASSQAKLWAPMITVSTGGRDAPVPKTADDSLMRSPSQVAETESETDEDKQHS